MTKKKRTTGQKRGQAPKVSDGLLNDLNLDGRGTASFDEKQWKKIKSGKNITYYNPSTKESISRYQYIKHTKGASPAQLAKQNKAKAIEEGRAPRQTRTRSDSRKANHIPDYLSPTKKSDTAGWSRTILEHRYQTIEEMRRTGKITDKQAKDLDFKAREEWRARAKMEELHHKLQQPLSPAERKRAKAEYDKSKAQYDKARKQLDKRHIIPHGTDMDETHYH